MSTDALQERPNLASGKLLIAITLSLFVIVPTVLLIIFPMIKRDLRQTPRTLHWSERSQWTPLPATGKDIERGMMSAARTDETYKDFGFHVPPEAELELMRLSRLAHGGGDAPAFASEEARERIEAGIQSLDDRYDFYPEFLLAKWHERSGDDDDARRLYAESFAGAEAAILKRYMTPGGEPAVGHDAGEIVIAFDQVENDAINTNLRLAYPHLETDETGRVYLPVFKTVYRVERRPDLTQVPPVRKDWFTFPGQLGALEPVTVRE